MLQDNPLQYLPSFEELPDSDNTPVDNELQVLIPKRAEQQRQLKEDLIAKLQARGIDPDTL